MSEQKKNSPGVVPFEMPTVIKQVEDVTEAEQEG